MENFDSEHFSVKSVKESRYSYGRLFIGNLYYNSTKIAVFESAEHGAPLNVRYADEDMEDMFKSYCRTIEDDDGFINTEETIIERMVNTFLVRKKVMAARKKKTYFSAIDEGVECEFEFKYPYSESVVNHIKSEYGENLVSIANELFDIYPDGIERVIQV